MSEQGNPSRLHLVPRWHRAKIERKDFIAEGTQGESLQAYSDRTHRS